MPSIEDRSSHTEEKIQDDGQLRDMLVRSGLFGCTVCVHVCVCVADLPFPGCSGVDCLAAPRSDGQINYYRSGLLKDICRYIYCIVNNHNILHVFN